jgi:hypothetical protein
MLLYGAIDPGARLGRRGSDSVRAVLDVRYTRDAYATVRRYQSGRACEATRGDSVRASFDVRYTRDAYATVRRYRSRRACEATRGDSHPSAESE